VINYYNTPNTLKRTIVTNLVTGKFFQVGFVKLDGSYRLMTCRLGVKKHLHGGKSTNLSDRYLTVFDMERLAYRNVSLDSLDFVKCGEIVRFAA